VSLLSQVTEFIFAHSAVGAEARKCVSDLEEENGQQDREHCLLQKEVVELREANTAQREEIGALVSAQESLTKK
jgi:hypothetical protein